MAFVSNNQALLIVVVVLLTFADCATSANRCTNCGATPVPYPLSTSPNCGDPLYKIRCVAGSLFFDTINNTYRIASFAPQAQRLIVRPASFVNRSSPVCITTDLPTLGFQLNPSLPFNITSSNTVMYLNCSDEALRSPVNCSSTSLCHTYINGSREGSACLGTAICCTFRAGGSTTSYSIRVREMGCLAYRSFVNLDPSLPASRWPQPGVELQWVSPLEPVCESQADCNSDSTCLPDPNLIIRGRRCRCNSGLFWDPIAGRCAEDVSCQDPDGCGGSNRNALIAGLASGFGATFVAVIIGVLYFKRQRRIRKERERLTREREEILNAGGGKSAKLFRGKEIRNATNNFSSDRLLGVGGFGEVYKGILEDGTVVAVKCAKLGNTKGIEQVLNEVRILCQVNHRSLLGLLGCCVELEQPLLVYEYMPNGTLLHHLHGKGYGLLTWHNRLSIAHATAQGLAYLHFSAVPPIYHRDVKSSNILLDEKLNAKVSDFGLSRLAHADLSHISTCAQGTIGYLDPEYYRKYQLTDKSDVYSFGVVLLELLTSEKVLDINRGEDDVNLAMYVKRLMEEKRLMDVVDPMLKTDASSLELDSMKSLAYLAIGCLEERRQNRPSMKEIEEEIGYIICIIDRAKEAEETNSSVELKRSEIRSYLLMDEETIADND